MIDKTDAGVDRPPACPICSREMLFCKPSHEKNYWACPVAHKPRGVVLRSQDIEYAFALAHVGIHDAFNDDPLGPFTAVESPEEVSGLVVSEVLDRLESEIEFKRMRQAREHDDLPVKPSASSQDQSNLRRWSA